MIHQIQPPFSADMDTQKIHLYQNHELIQTYQIGDKVVFNQVGGQSWIGELHRLNTESQLIIVRTAGLLEDHHLIQSLSLAQFMLWNGTWDGQMEHSLDATVRGWYPYKTPSVS